MLNKELIAEDYSKNFSLYSTFCNEVVNQLNFLLSENGIQLGFPIEFRIKKLESIVQKMEANNLAIDSVVSLNDFAGIRIICLFYKDMQRVEKILEENFIIHRREDTLNRLSDNTFGYGSIHFEISPKKEWLTIPTFKKLANCKAEVQLRTGAQHIWAAASHILQYKKQIDIPLELRRSINRAAALLEMVDLEFERVEVERVKYVTAISNRNITDEVLNIENLKFILDKILPAENRQPNEPYSELLEDLQHFKITTTTELEKLFERHFKSVKADSDAYVQRLKKERPNVTHSGYYHSGFVRHSLRKEFGKAAGVYIDERLSRKK